MSRALALPAFRSLRRPRVTDAIVSHVKDMIVRGTLGPDAPLPSERDLAELWRVGRPTVREAIQQLETLGFIEARGARRRFVRSLTSEAMQEPLRRVASEEAAVVAQILDVRMALEGWVAAEAATAATPAQVHRIQAIVDRLSAAAERGEPLSAIDAEFHRALVEATGNTVMRHLMQTLTSLELSVRNFKKRVGFKQTRPLEFTACHREAARAIAARDPAAAQRAMVAHLTMVKEMLAGQRRARRRPARVS